MAVAVRPIRRPLAAVTKPLAGAGFAAWPVLASLVAVSVFVRLLVGWLRPTPIYLGDEYLYAALGRSIAETGRPLVRGEAADFPALLQPILTAPAWLVQDVGTGYHLVQGLGALAMSLAALPVYWLARRLDLSQWLSLGLAALALALPDLIYAGWVLAEPFAYPLVLGAVAAGVAALAQPSPRSQLLFVALAGLSAFGRIQFVLLPVCFAAAVLVVGLRERRLRHAIREQALALVLLAAPVGVALVLGPSRVLAFYGGVVHAQVDPAEVARHSGPNLLVLLYASGFVLVPGAILGLVLAFARPRGRAELAFAALTVVVTVTLLVEAGLFGASDRAQERYLFYVLPLVAIAFGLYASRGWPFRLQHALLGAGLVTVAAVVPLAGFAAAEEKMHSPLLYAEYRIEQWLGSPGSGSMLVALAVTVALALVVVASARPRVATGVAIGLAFVACAGFSAVAAVFDTENTTSARRSFFGPDRSWVDNARLGEVTLVRNVGGQRGSAFQQLFWNRSVDRLVLMPGATIIDPFRADPARVTDDGTIVAAGRPLTGALLMDEHAASVELTGATRVGAAPGYSLYRSAGQPRLSLLFGGRYYDGWLTSRGGIRLWPQPGSRTVAGLLTLELEAPATARVSTVRFELPGEQRVSVQVPPRSVASLQLPVCSLGPWAANFLAPVTGYVGSRPVSVRVQAFRFVPSASGCSPHTRPRQTIVTSRVESSV
jgi:hypothetical protein